jgi:uncharacterized protein involved in exopolysaccharide biosynthesis
MATKEQIKTVKLADVLDSIGRFLLYLVHNIKLVLLLVICTTALAIAYYFFQKPAYEGKVTFILEEKTPGMAGGLSGLASQIGIDIGSMGTSSGMFAGDNILDILKSRTIIEKVLLSKVDSSKGAAGSTMADLYLDLSHLKVKWQNKSDELANISYNKLADGMPHSLLQDSVLYVIYDKLYNKHITVERVNKKGSIIKISTVSTNPVFSKVFTERLLTETKKLYIDVKTSTTAANVERLQQRADSLMKALNAKSYQSATMQLVDANNAFKSAAVPAEVSQRDKMVAYAIYTEVMKNLEASRMALASQTPVIQLLDYSRYPLDDQKKSFPLLLTIGIMGGILLALVFAFFSYPSAAEHVV